MAQEFSCTMDDCDFMIRASEEDEVIQMVRQHAQDRHGMSMDESDIRNGMQSA